MVQKLEVIEEDVTENLDDMLVFVTKKRKKVVGGKKLYDNILQFP